MTCSHCGSAITKQNGHTHYGKQHYFCPACHRQFVAGGQEWFVSDADKLLINMILLESISLADICRVCDVSQTWLLAYLKHLYAELPDDLGADLRLPDLEAYLADRMDEEISRLAAIKKNTSVYQYYITIEKGEPEALTGCEPAVWPASEACDIGSKDLLIK